MPEYADPVVEALRRRDDLVIATGVTRGAALREVLKKDEALRDAYLTASAAFRREVQAAEEVIRRRAAEAIRNTDRHAREQKRAARRADRRRGRTMRAVERERPQRLTHDELADAMRRLGERPPAVDPPQLIEARSASLVKDLERRGAMRRFLHVDLLDLNPALPSGYKALANRLLGLLDRPQLIAVGGPRGRGKTSVVTGLMRRFAEVDRLAWYVTARAFLDEWTTGSWERKSALRERYAKADLLIIDEYQDRAASPREEAEIADLIDHRYGHQRSTILVTNLAAAAFEESIGAKLLRRLLEEGGFLQCEWPRVQELLQGYDIDGR